MNGSAAMRFSVALALFLAGCGGQAEIQGGDYADAASTVGVLAAGAELNPLIAGANPVVGATVLLGAKQAGKQALIDAGHDPEYVNEAISAAGYGAACWNVAFLAGAAAPAGALFGFMCGAVTWPQETGEKTNEIHCNRERNYCWDDNFICTNGRCFRKTRRRR